MPEQPVEKTWREKVATGERLTVDDFLRMGGPRQVACPDEEWHNCVIVDYNSIGVLYSYLNKLYFQPWPQIYQIHEE